MQEWTKAEMGLDGFMNMKIFILSSPSDLGNGLKNKCVEHVRCVCAEEGEGSREKPEVLCSIWIFTASKCWKGTISFILDFF